MAPGLSLGRRRLARACGMEGLGFPNTPNHGLSLTISIHILSCAWRGVCSQSRSHQPTPAVRTRDSRLEGSPSDPHLFSLLISLFFHTGCSTTCPSTYTPTANTIQMPSGDQHCLTIDAAWNSLLWYASTPHFNPQLTYEINASLAPRLGCTNRAVNVLSFQPGSILLWDLHMEQPPFNPELELRAHY